MNRVVAHLFNGQLVKGQSFDLDPARPRCHVRTDAGAVEVKLADVKALYFVRSFEGDPKRSDAQAPDPADPRNRGATKIEITFTDGERLVAYTNRYPPRGKFFFVVPVDPASNNSRILVNQAAVRSHRAL
jgi:hypothetical protein